MNSAQYIYTTTEKKLLSIEETLKEFLNILLGHQITVYTDHKNLTYKHFNTERVMLWRLILEEFGPELKYIKGENNIVANALSCLEKSGNQEILTSLNSMATMTRICLTAPIQFVITILPKHKKLMLNYNKI